MSKRTVVEWTHVLVQIECHSKGTLARLPSDESLGLARNKELVIEILREVTGAATVLWRPTLDILQEEGLYLDPLPVAAEVCSQTHF